MKLEILYILRNEDGSDGRDKNGNEGQIYSTLNEAFEMRESNLQSIFELEATGRHGTDKCDWPSYTIE